MVLVSIFFSLAVFAQRSEMARPRLVPTMPVAPFVRPGSAIPVVRPAVRPPVVGGPQVGGQSPRVIPVFPGSPSRPVGNVPIGNVRPTRPSIVPRPGYVMPAGVFPSGLASLAATIPGLIGGTSPSIFPSGANGLANSLGGSGGGFPGAVPTYGGPTGVGSGFSQNPVAAALSALGGGGRGDRAVASNGYGQGSRLSYNESTAAGVTRPYDFFGHGTMKFYTRSGIYGESAKIWDGCAPDALIRGGLNSNPTGTTCRQESMNARFAEHLDRFFLGCVKAAAREAGLAEPKSVFIAHMGCHVDRNKRGGNGKSEHAYARALDISGFRLTDASGRSVVMSAHQRDVSRSSANRVFYDSFRLCWRRTLPASCGSTSGSIGIPGSTPGLYNNDLHRDHIHLELPKQCGS